MMQLEYETADFSYNGAEDASGLPARVAIFADRPSMRDQIREDLDGAGFRTIDGGEIANLLDGPATMLGDIVLIDCPVLDAKRAAALSRLDMRAARSDTQLIVSTSLDALDEVFAALDQCGPQILVQPSRAERIVAVGHVLADIANPRVREMTENDRMNLLHLSRQVEAIAQKLEGLSGSQVTVQSGLTLHSSRDAEQEENATENCGQRFHSGRPPLPDARLVRQMIANRQARAKHFSPELFSDPAWDMLLDLTAAHAEQSRVSVTSLCIAAAVPATTALRWIKQLVASGVFERIADASDKRRAFVALSDQSIASMARYFAEVKPPFAQAA